MATDIERLVDRFDHHDAEFSTEGTAQAVYRGIRDRCPVAHSTAHGGFWVVAQRTPAVPILATTYSRTSSPRRSTAAR
jgi:hypothetical protein